MWRAINVVSEKYLVKYSRMREVCVIHLTNLINIWTEEVSTSSLIQRCKVQNPLIEADDDESLIQHIFSLLEGKEDNITFQSHVEGEGRTLEVKTKLAGIRFNFTFNMKLSSPELLFEEVTRPLLLLTRQLHTTHNTLCELLEAKDAEIAEYKAEGAQMKRRKLETEPFNRNDISRSIDLSSSIFCSSGFIDLSSHQRDSSSKNGGDADVKSQSTLKQEVSPEIPNDPPDFQEETQVSQLSPTSTQIKEEPAPIVDSRASKRRKPVNKPKLRL